MDPLTHLLTGACMGRSGFNRKSALATVTMVLAAEAADIDVLWALKSSTAGLQHHRGITHSFVGAPFVAAGVLGLVYLGYRFLWRRQQAPAPVSESEPAPPSSPPASSRQPPVRWGFLYFCALLAALSHLLLDYSTAYGIRLFEPFNFRWYSWDIVYIIEPLMLLALIAGLAVPALLGLINQEIGARSKGPRGRGGAIAALVCVVLIWVVRDYEHRRVVAAMNAFVYRGAEPVRLAAYPYMINPFRWHGVVETADFFTTVPADSLGPQVDADAGQLFYKPAETNITLAAKSSYLGRVYLDWAVFPLVHQENIGEDANGYFVEFQDLRYTYPSMARRPPLVGFVWLDSGLKVLEEGLDPEKSRALERLQRGPERQ